MPASSWIVRGALALALAGCAPETVSISGMTPGASERTSRATGFQFPTQAVTVPHEAGAAPVLLHVDAESRLWVRQNGGTNLLRFGPQGDKQATYALGPSGPDALVFGPSGLPRALVKVANAPASGVLRPGWSRTEAAAYVAWSQMTDAGQFEAKVHLESPTEVQPDGQGGLWALWNQPNGQTGALEVWMTRLAPDGTASAVRKVAIAGLARTGYAPIGGDRAGNLWVVWRHEVGHKIERFTPDGKRSGEIGYGNEMRSVTAAVEDGEGNMWLHYRGAGKLVVIRPNGQRVGQVTPEHGPGSVQGSAGGAAWVFTMGRPRENGAVVRYAKDGTAKEKIASPYEDYGLMDWIAGADGSLWILDKPSERLLRMGP